MTTKLGLDEDVPGLSALPIARVPRVFSYELSVVGRQHPPPLMRGLCPGLIAFLVWDGVEAIIFPRHRLFPQFHDLHLGLAAPIVPLPPHRSVRFLEGCLPPLSPDAQANAESHGPLNGSPRRWRG